MRSSVQEKSASQSISSDRILRPDIQALRALAVVLVLLFHLWPSYIPGGYVGVDVFFVISGFLITAHLFRELDTSGTIRIGKFWARRIRRLLPAAFTVLISVGLVSFFFLPQLYWTRTFTEIGTSVLYIENWFLANQAVDYLGAEQDPSALQHYWSLSIEEQFYFVWPVIIFISYLLFKRFTKSSSPAKTSLLTTISIILMVSFSASVLFTYSNPAEAYFVTYTRMWELAAGGAVFLISERLPSSNLVRKLLLWGGVALIAISALTFSEETYFPGYIALIPIVGAAFVILSDNPTGKFSARHLISWKLIQATGDWSYAIYLWHWPLIILIPIIIEHQLTFWWKIGIIICTFILSALTKKFIEDPLRHTKGILRNTKRSFSFMSVGILIIAGLSVSVTSFLSFQAAQAQAALEQEWQQLFISLNSCVGASAMVTEHGCTDIHMVTESVDPAFADQDIDEGLVRGGCHQGQDQNELLICDYGELDTPKKTIALVGDSHARHWTNAIAEYAKFFGWKLQVMTMSSCPGLPLLDLAQQEIPNCKIWGERVFDFIHGSNKLDAVIFANYADFAPISLSESINMMQLLEQKDVDVILIKDNPNRASLDTAPECIASLVRGADDSLCSTERSSSIKSDEFDEIAKTNDNIDIVDLTDYFCDDNVCHSLIGGLVVFHDTHHLTGSFSRSLAPYIGSEISKILNQK